MQNGRKGQRDAQTYYRLQEISVIEKLPQKSCIAVLRDPRGKIGIKNVVLHRFIGFCQFANGVHARHLKEKPEHLYGTRAMRWFTFVVEVD